MRTTSIQLPFCISWDRSPGSKSSDFVKDILKKSRIPMHLFFIPKIIPECVPRPPLSSRKAERKRARDAQEAAKCVNKNEPRKKWAGPSSGPRWPGLPGRPAVARLYIYIYIYTRIFARAPRALDSLTTHDLGHSPLDITPKTMLARGWPSTRNMHMLHDPYYFCHEKTA